jgi:hypothetical protein
MWAFQPIFFLYFTLPQADYRPSPELYYTLEPLGAIMFLSSKMSLKTP